MTSTLLSKVLKADNIKLFNATAGGWAGRQALEAA
jgi:hypothetical protein